MKTTDNPQRANTQQRTPAAHATAKQAPNAHIQSSPRMVAQRQQLERAFGSPVQRLGMDEEELLQGKFETVQRVEEEEELMQGKFAPVQRVEEEELLQGKFATVQRKGPEEEELLQGKFAPIQRQGSEEEEPLQPKFGAAQLKQELTPQPNNTGLPDNLKSGIESLSGMSLDHVKVHYNSSQPAQLNALAYAQGTDIHVASGQEQHLPHEAWHVVQQAQGRVKPTMQMKDDVPVNDDAGLEKEADVMGAKALLMPDTHQLTTESSVATTQRDIVIQRHPQHWGADYDEEVKKILELKPGKSVFGTTFSNIKKRILEYKDIDEKKYERRAKKMTKLQEQLNTWIERHTTEKMTDREKEIEKAIPKMLLKVEYEQEEIKLSRQRDKGEIAPDMPSSWQQTKEFPTNSGYEITFRGLVGLNLGKDGIDPERLGSMEEIDQKLFEVATPSAVLRFANTGANISLSRSFDFANGIVETAKAGSGGKSNLIVVTIVRPGFGIDVEANAEADIRAGKEEITKQNIIKARAAKEVATIRNPTELIMGWVEIPCQNISKKEGATALGKKGLIKFQWNPAYTGKDLPELKDMGNYDDFVKLLATYR